MTGMHRTPPALSLVDISKAFDGETVLDQVSFSLQQGEICCLMGENGAGKTTLMRIISGQIAPDSGTIQINGRSFSKLTPAVAHQLGIYLVLQQPELVPMLSVEDNVFLGKELTKPNSVFVNHCEQQRQLQQTFQIMGWSLDPAQYVAALSPMEQRMVDLARALTGGAKILIFDELSAFSDKIQREKIHDLVLRLCRQGISIIYISHDLEECQSLSSRLVILKAGQIIQDYSDSHQLSVDQLISNLTGNLCLNRYPRTDSQQGPVVLRVQQLATKSGLHDINLYVRSGEIVGVIGMENCGQDLLFRVLTGTESFVSGHISVNGKPVVFSNASVASNAGISSIGTDVSENLFSDMDSYFNVSIANLKRISTSAFIGPTSIHKTVYEYLTHLGSAQKNLHKPVAVLSQGEKQKVALSKMMFSRSSIYIMNNPSSNLDVVSRVEFYNSLNWLAQNNQAILLLSTNPEELVGMCDRIYLMKQNRIVNEVAGQQKTVSSIMLQLVDL